MKISKEQQRKKRHMRIRSRLSGNATRPRLVVHRSLGHIYAQLINDDNGVVITNSSSLKLKQNKGQEIAKQVGLDIAKKALGKKISTCVFDRNGYLYHGRVKAIAEGAREGGLKF